jgi:AcrR family transcriptional regulator
MPAPGPSSLIPRHPTALRLIDAAVRSMDADGEAGLRVDAVVADAGVTIPVLYHHFGNREGLVQAAHVARLRRSMEQSIGSLEARIRAVEDREEFLAMIDTVLELVFQPNHDRFIRVNVLGATYGRPDLQAEVAELQRDTWSRIAAVLEEPQRRGWIRADLDLQVFAGWFFGLVMSRILMDIQGDAIDTSPWNDSTRQAVFAVLDGAIQLTP